MYIGNRFDSERIVAATSLVTSRSFLTTDNLSSVGSDCAVERAGNRKRHRTGVDRGGSILCQDRSSGSVRAALFFRGIGTGRHEVVRRSGGGNIGSTVGTQ